jgi:transcription elongation factor GreB
LSTVFIKEFKNYITPSGLQRLRDELRFLLTRERPAVTQVVAWAASNGDRSENADYHYGKRRLREIDRRIRFLTKRIGAAEVVDPEAPRSGRAATQVFFGATVRYADAAGMERLVSVVGVDEVDLDRNHISWVSPLARALMKSGPGDCVILHAPSDCRSSRCVMSASPWSPSSNHLGPRPRPRLAVVKRRGARSPSSGSIYRLIRRSCTGLPERKRST